MKWFKMQNLFHKIRIFSVRKYGEGEGVVFDIFKNSYVHFRVTSAGDRHLDLAGRDPKIDHV